MEFRDAMLNIEGNGSQQHQFDVLCTNLFQIFSRAQDFNNQFWSSEVNSVLAKAFEPPVMCYCSDHYF